MGIFTATLGCQWKLDMGGKKHSVKAVVSSRLVHPLLSTDWPGFHKLVGQCVGVYS